MKNTLVLILRRGKVQNAMIEAETGRETLDLESALVTVRGDEIVEINEILLSEGTVVAVRKNKEVIPIDRLIIPLMMKLQELVIAARKSSNRLLETPLLILEGNKIEGRCENTTIWMAQMKINQKAITS
jgi:hypothetical protein